MRVGQEAREALAEGRPVVALESTIISHGLPRPDNLRIAREIEQTVREHGAVPATVGMVEGELIIGLDDGELTRLAMGDDVAKLSVRDLGIAAVLKRDGATTVASTGAAAAIAGIRVFATGGLGGVHREAFDESADLVTLARTRLIVVCAGVKSILDIGATLERLETLGVGVVGYGTDRFPGFFIGDSGFGVDWRLDSPEEVARAFKAQVAQGVSGAALVVANPLPEEEQLDPALHDRVLAEGLSIVERDNVTGKRVTPVLLRHFHSATHGASLAANVRIILRNAALAAQIAAAL
ncbi:MAG TPA: pseudouridine-5'-phosphate glycosidase [Candidatus Limnocylindrales bacterium]|nr:pseudouridine-5'-phosphate glycosidase [Candidatus Limnocylindrales bacterium]